MSDKKRKLADDGLAEEDGAGLAHELKAIKRVMNQLLDHSRSQTEEMKSMRGEMNVMNNEMKKMRKAHNQVESQFDDVNNKQKYHEILLKNQKWKYSIPFNDSIFTVDDRQLIDKIRKETCDMRQGRCNGTIIFSQSRQYNTSFLPHWEQFAEALGEYQYGLKCLPKETATSFRLVSVELPNDVLGILSNSLKCTHFKCIDLRNNSFGQEGIEFALNYMQKNRKLEEFRLTRNQIESDDVDRLCQIVREHPSIHTIELDRCCGDFMNGHNMLCSIMTAGANKLTCIDLSGNAISTGGSTFISDFLSTNPILEKLHLMYNNLDDDDAHHIADALKDNINLIRLNIYGNNLTDTGWESLLKAEFDSSTLNSAADSNHACYIHDRFEFNGISDGGIVDQTDKSFQKAVRQKKIYSLLSSRNRKFSNVQYFDDVPVEFLPDMLRSIEQYSEYHVGDNKPDQVDDDPSALSVTFEVMRRWDKVFSVYEFPSCSA